MDYFVGYGQKHAAALLKLTFSKTAVNVGDASWCGVCEVQRQEAISRAGKMSIQGFQLKLSAALRIYVAILGER